jgi:hypothetical protein
MEGGRGGLPVPLWEARLLLHWQLAILALALLAFAAASGRIEGTSITAPMVFTAVGHPAAGESLGLIHPPLLSSTRSAVTPQLTVLPTHREALPPFEELAA